VEAAGGKSQRKIGGVACDVRPNDSIVIARQLRTPKPTPPYQTTRQNRPEFGKALVGCHVIGMERVGSQ
jgi:hypothetical protein